MAKKSKRARHPVYRYCPNCSCSDRVVEFNDLPDDATTLKCEYIFCTKCLKTVPGPVLSSKAQSYKIKITGKRKPVNALGKHRKLINRQGGHRPLNR